MRRATPCPGTTKTQHIALHVAVPLSPVRQFAAETKQQLQIVALDDRRALSSVGQRFGYNVVRRRLALQHQLSRTQWHDLVEDRGVQLGLGLGNRGALTACVSNNDARDWTHFVLVYVHVLRVRRRVGRICVL